MYIQLPERFVFRKDPYNYSVVKQEVLHIYGDVSFRKLMYKLTLDLKGKNWCVYCDNSVAKKKITLDHVIPQDLGGPTIPENLVPCCEKCNSEKSNLDFKQFMVYRSLKKQEKKEYIKSIEAIHESIRKSGNYSLPKDWLETRQIDEIFIKSNCSINMHSKKSNLTRIYHTKYGHLPVPVVIDRNGFVLDGHTVFMVAKELQLTQISVIVLENVELHL